MPAPGRGSDPFSPRRLQEFPQGDSVVPFPVPCREEKRHDRVRRKDILELPDHNGPRPHLPVIPPAELLPPQGIVGIPDPEFPARSRVADPPVRPDPFPCHPPRPEPFHQHPVPVPWKGRFVYPLHPYRHSPFHPFPCPSPVQRRFGRPCAGMPDPAPLLHNNPSAGGDEIGSRQSHGMKQSLKSPVTVMGEPADPHFRRAERTCTVR